MSLTPFAFVDGALDRADHLRDDHEALSALWPQAGVIVLDADGRALADPSKSLRIVRGGELDGGPGITTFPQVIFSYARRGVNPTIFAAAALLIAVVTIAVIIYSIVLARQNRRHLRKKK